MLAAVAVVSCFALDNADESILDKAKPKGIRRNLKAFHLRKAADFVLLIKQATVYKTDDFLVRRLDNQQGHARLGIAISKKKVKQAVKRNRIKRIVRETFRKYCLKLPNKDYMISYRGAPNPGDVAPLHKKLIHIWEREVVHCSN